MLGTANFTEESVVVYGNGTFGESEIRIFELALGDPSLERANAPVDLLNVEQLNDAIAKSETYSVAQNCILTNIITSLLCILGQYWFL